MKENETEILEKRGIKPTANRILVLRALIKASHPVSLADVESQNLYMDKSSIFRVLTLFRKHELVHTFEDGSGTQKYELCLCSHPDHGHDVHHVHFYCEVCQQTYCFEHQSVPMVQLPDGFERHSVNYMIKGVCPKCKQR